MGGYRDGGYRENGWRWIWEGGLYGVKEGDNQMP